MTFVNLFLPCKLYMATLNQIAERIAYAKNQPLNTILRENIKFSVKYWRAMMIRRDMAINGLSDEFLQRIDIPLQRVDEADTCSFSLGCENILRTANPVPKPIRVKNDILFKFVGTPKNKDETKNKAFSYIEEEEINFRRYNKFTSKTICYTYVNQYIYIFNNMHLKSIRVQSAFSDPSKINISCTGCYNDDMEFPIGDDMIETIVKGILTGEMSMQIPPTDEEVRVEPNGAINI